MKEERLKQGRLRKPEGKDREGVRQEAGNRGR